MNTWEKGGGRKANKEIKFASVWREWTGIPEREGSELFLPAVAGLQVAISCFILIFFSENVKNSENLA